MICRFSRLDKKLRKKTTINPIKKNYNKCFQCAATVAINYEKNGENPERTSNRKSFISKYNCKGINYPSEIDDRKKFEKKNSAISLNVFYEKETEICLAYISKHNSNREKQVAFLMISNGEGSYHFPVKNVITLKRNSFKT